MRALAIDTTTRSGSVAVVNDDRVIAELAGDARRTHGERLPGECAAVLERAGLAPAALDLIVVASGPGAFTGLRIGMAAAQALALVLDRPAVGVSALEAHAALALEAAPGAPRAAVWMDALRGEVFGAVYARAAQAEAALRPARDPAVAPPADLLRDWEADLPPGTVFAGDGARRYAALLDPARGWVAPLEVPLLAGAIGRIGIARARAGQAGPPHALQPLYVRRPDAERDRTRGEAAPEAPFAR